MFLSVFKWFWYFNVKNIKIYYLDIFSIKKQFSPQNQTNIIYVSFQKRKQW